MRVEEIPLEEIQALLGEKDMIIYALSKNYREYKNKFEDTRSLLLAKFQIAISFDKDGNPILEQLKQNG